MRRQSNGAVAEPSAPSAEVYLPEEVQEDTALAASLPPGELDGYDEFGLRNWVSFDPQRGKFTCENQASEHDEFQGIILESRVVRVMKDSDGNVTCSSSDRVTSDSGRIGRLCETCEDRDVDCSRRWWIGWQAVPSGVVYAHTLSQTGSINFHRYVQALQRQDLLPSQVLSRIFVEEARRQKGNSLYRRVQFEQVAGTE